MAGAFFTIAKNTAGLLSLCRVFYEEDSKLRVG